MDFYNQLLTRYLGGGGGGGDITLIETVPTYTGTMTYDGTEQTATFNNYDSEKMTVSGNTATNAGTYTATFKPKKGYYWDNGDSTATNEPKTVTWSIEKAKASITLSESAVTLNAETLYTDVSITATVGTGALSVASSDTTVATVGDIENDTFRITANNDENSGNATVTVSMAESDNYTSASATVAVNVSFITIYGAEWDGSSNPAWTRTDAAANFADPNPYYEGMSGTPSSPFDNLMPWSGMEIVEDANAGTLVKIPKFWYKWTLNGTKIKLQIADGEVEGFNVSPAHQARNTNETDRDIVYVGAYISATGDYKSKANALIADKFDALLATERTGIHNLGSDIWQWDFAMYSTIAMLYLVEFANWNSQAKIGYGGGDASVENGETDAIAYHTGTIGTSRDSYSMIKYRNIERLWGGCMQRIDGMYFNGDYKENVNIIKDPSLFSNDSNGINVGKRLHGEFQGDFEKILSGFTQSNVNGFEYVLLPSSGVPVTTGYSYYVCDIYAWGDYPSSRGNALSLGYPSNDEKSGLFAYRDYLNPTSSYVGACSRLMKLPNNA